MVEVKVNEALPLYIINLKKDSKKREKILARLESLSLSGEIIEAVDGKVLSKESLFQNGMKVDASLTPGEIGCALSHRLIYEKMVKKNIQKAIILEDDVYFAPSFKKIVTLLLDLPLHYGLILLGHHSCNSLYLETMHAIRRCRRFTRKHCLTRPLEEVCGTYGYMITLPVAKELLEETRNLKKPIDHYTGDCKKSWLYMIHKPVVLVDMHLQSAIEKERSLKSKNWKDRLLRYSFIFALYKMRHTFLHLIRGVLCKECLCLKKVSK